MHWGSDLVYLLKRCTQDVHVANLSCSGHAGQQWRDSLVLWPLASVPCFYVCFSADEQKGSIGTGEIAMQAVCFARLHDILDPKSIPVSLYFAVKL
mmetsp:Transcript_44995/g.73320  ORF Transcript_44995/g.73320 Transcript_44995/m.73320 type:complete len:96 (+) Transcript_44995:2018-2305(+)